ncbi:MAG: fibronectin type III domain-containing protein [Chitinophagaceae bacterium]
MAIQRAISNFARLSDTAFDQKAAFIIERMTNNPAFATPIPTLAEVETARTGFNAALIIVAAGSKQGVVIKNQARKDLGQLLRRLAMYVTAVANDNSALIVGAGFDVNKVPVPAGPLPKPIGLKVEAVAAGTIKISIKKVPNANNYLFEYTLAPVLASTTWTQQLSSKCSILFSGLQKGVEYAFRVAPVGSDPARNYSDPVSAYVNY